MKKKLLALTLLTALSTSLFAGELKPDEDFSRKYHAQVLQSVVFGKTKAMKVGDEVSSAVGAGAVSGAGTIAGVAGINGATTNGVVNGAASGLIIGAFAGLITGGIASASNASTIECMDNAVNNGEKMECASTTWLHIGQLFAQAGLIISPDNPLPIPLKLDNTRQGLGGFQPDPVPQFSEDGSRVLRYAIANSDGIPTVITVKGKYVGEEYAAKYPETLGYEWAISSVQKYSKPLVIRNPLNIEQWNEKATPFLNDPANFAKS